MAVPLSQLLRVELLLTIFPQSIDSLTIELRQIHFPKFTELFLFPAIITLAHFPAIIQLLAHPVIYAECLFGLCE